MDFTDGSPSHSFPQDATEVYNRLLEAEPDGLSKGQTMFRLVIPLLHRLGWSSEDGSLEPLDSDAGDLLLSHDGQADVVVVVDPFPFPPLFSFRTYLAEDFEADHSGWDRDGEFRAAWRGEQYWAEAGELARDLGAEWVVWTNGAYYQFNCLSWSRTPDFRVSLANEIQYVFPLTLYNQLTASLTSHALKMIAVAWLLAAQRERMWNEDTAFDIEPLFSHCEEEYGISRDECLEAMATMFALLDVQRYCHR